MTFLAVIFLALVMISGIIYLLTIEKTMNIKKESPSDFGEKANENSQEKYNSAFHLFLYLVSFLSLGFLVAGVIISFHQAINKFIPDNLDSGYYSGSYFNNDAIKFGLSALIVTIPIYYGILFFLNKKLEKNEIPPESLIRKTITYLALVAFSGMAIGSLVGIVYNYFDGELTTRFVLKSLSFLCVSLFFFGFYFWEIRRSVFSRGVFVRFFSMTLMLAIIAMILGFFVIDSPSTARDKRVDNDLVNNMKSSVLNINAKFRGQDKYGNQGNARQVKRDKAAMELAYQGKSLEEIEDFLNKFYGEAQKGELPSSEDMIGQVDENVVYKPGERNEYELCGTFKRASKDEGGRRQNDKGKWAHPAGNHCFKFDAETGDMYDLRPMMTKE